MYHRIKLIMWENIGQLDRTENQEGKSREKWRGILTIDRKILLILYNK